MYLSLEECRDLIPNSDYMSDDEVDALRSELTAIAGVVVDAWDSLDDPEFDQSELTPAGDIIDQLMRGLEPMEFEQDFDVWSDLQ